MKTPVRIVIVAALAVAVIGALALKKGRTAMDPAAATAAPGGAAKLPKLVDLGAGTCIPCKMMKPILDDLKANYADRFVTEFIDVWENPDAGKQYGVETIPTQIFYDASGKERFRHVGFFAKEDILAKWKKLGVDVSGKAAPGVAREEAVKPDAGSGPAR